MCSLHSAFPMVLDQHFRTSRSPAPSTRLKVWRTNVPWEVSAKNPGKRVNIAEHPGPSASEKVRSCTARSPRLRMMTGRHRLMYSLYSDSTGGQRILPGSSASSCGSRRHLVLNSVGSKTVTVPSVHSSSRRSWHTLAGKVQNTKVAKNPLLKTRLAKNPPPC